MTDMTETRFEELAAIHGAALPRWPADERAGAEALLAASPRAQAILESERALDAALDGWVAPAPSDALMTRILGDAADVAAAQPASAAYHAAAEKPGLMARLFGDWGWRPAGAMAACLAIGFVAGISGAPAPLDTGSEVAAAQGETLLDIAFFAEDDSDPFGLETL